MTPTDHSPPARRRSPRALVRVGVLIVSVVLALALAEWTVTTFNLFGVHYNDEVHRYLLELCELKLTNPDGTRDLDGTLFEQKPSAQARFHDFEVRLNSLGFRGPEIEVNKPEGTWRIVVLGDSVTFGWGVDDEHTFLRRFERQLNQRGDDRRYEVVNTGHLSYDTNQQLGLLEGRAIALAPDLVVLLFVGNDIEPSRDAAEALLDAQAEAQATDAPESDTSWFSGLMPAMTAVVRRLLDPPPPITTGEARPDAPRPEDTEAGARGWDRSKRAILAMRRLCAARGSRFVVLDYGFYDVPSLPEFCTENDIPYAGIKFTKDELALPIYNSLFDPHVNARGHAILVEKLERAFDDLDLPPR